MHFLEGVYDSGLYKLAQHNGVRDNEIHWRVYCQDVRGVFKTRVRDEIEHLFLKLLFSAVRKHVEARRAALFRTVERVFFAVNLAYCFDNRVNWLRAQRYVLPIQKTQAAVRAELSFHALAEQFLSVVESLTVLGIKLDRVIHVIEVILYCGVPSLSNISISVRHRPPFNSSLRYSTCCTA